MAPPPRNERDIFLEALDCAPASRVTYLDQACGSNLDLRRSVEELLARHDGAGDFLKGGAEHLPPAAPPASTVAEGPGSTIGRYKLLQKIGEGGFGVVYMAEQREPVKRRVALKIIKLGMDTRQVIGRFEAERQALALMDHPNIAKVLDGGSTDTGRPYFVMELVRGVPITQFCDEHRLGTEARLQLFIDVCLALHHAHQKGIIHRDVKPSNVMVSLHDANPVPKVIDFGVAKATHTELTDKTLFTRFHELLGTPAYMSPEQAHMSGLDVDTRTDIYSLGVLLYQLLTGRTPFAAEELLEAGFDEMRRRIRDDEPVKPSTRLRTLSQPDQTAVAQERSTDPQRLRHLLRGDLDWIVMKCLEKDRTTRYESAAALAHDLERYLRNEPVSAAAPSAIYTLRKFARRHRTTVFTTVLVAVLLITGTIVSATFGIRASRAEKRARQEAAIAEAVNRFLNDDLFAQAGPETEPDRELQVVTLLDRASGQVEARFRDQPLVEAAIRATLARTYQNLSDFGKAEPHALRAFELRFHELGELHPDTLQAMSELAGARLRRGQLEDARKLGERVLELAMDALGPYHPLTISFQCRLTRIYYRTAESDLANQTAAAAVSACRKISGVPVEDQMLALDVRGRMLGRQGLLAEGEAYLLEAKAIVEREHGPHHPLTLRTKNNLAAYYHNVGIHADEAEVLYRDSLEHQRRLFGESHDFTRTIRANLALLYLRQERYAEAFAQKVALVEHAPPNWTNNPAPGFRELLDKANWPTFGVVAPAAWKTRTAPPAATWTRPEYDDNDWQTAEIGNSAEVWLRHNFKLPQMPREGPVLILECPGTPDLYLNGRRLDPTVLRSVDGLWVVADKLRVLSSLRPGTNTLALHIRNIETQEHCRLVLLERPQTDLEPGWLPIPTR